MVLVSNQTICELKYHGSQGKVRNQKIHTPSRSARHEKDELKNRRYKLRKSFPATSQRKDRLYRKQPELEGNCVF